METLKVVSFLWRKQKKGFQLPTTVEYGAQHVYTHYNMIKRNLTVPFEYMCFTDRKLDLPKEIIQKPLWDKCKSLGGCYNRLYTFSEDMRDLIGERFICIDLDCVIVNNIDSIVNRKEDFIINSYQPWVNDPAPKDQLYNGGMYMMTAGARSKVWDSFNPYKAPQEIKQHPEIIGSDQAWIRLVLGREEATWGPKDGIYEIRNIGRDLPDNAKILFFAGRRDPTEPKYSWLKEYYK